MKKPGSSLANSLLAGSALCWVLYLSRSGRGAVDWLVIGLVAFAILWNLVNLVRGLGRSGGGRGL